MKRMMLSVCLAAAAALTSAPGPAVVGAAGAPAAQAYVEPTTLWRFRFRGRTVLAVDSAETNALSRIEGVEQRSLGMVFRQQMPMTRPLYRLAKLEGGRPSPEVKLYTTNKAEADNAVKNLGWVSEGVLCYVTSGFEGRKPLHRLLRGDDRIYVTDLAELKRLRDAGYKEEGIEANLLEYPFGWRAEYWMFARSYHSGEGPRPENYKLVCRRGDGAFFAKDGVAFKFSKSARQLGQDLAPGECAWIDRKMGADEPEIVQAPLTNQFSPARAEGDEEYWTFSVYNDGRGRMIVVEAEPGRPAVAPDNSIEVRRDVNTPELERPKIQEVRPIRPAPSPVPKP